MPSDVGMALRRPQRFGSQDVRFGSEADIRSVSFDVRFVPTADIGVETQRGEFDPDSRA